MDLIIGFRPRLKKEPKPISHPSNPNFKNVISTVTFGFRFLLTEAIKDFRPRLLIELRP